MQHRIIMVSLFLFTITPVASAAPGESAVVTLVLPYGARASAMGEVGTALANDESALFFNPAGLGIRNESWRKGAASFSIEPLLPAFKISDLWHTSLNGYYQISDKWGGIALYNNYTNIGQNTYTDALGREGNKVRSWESITVAGWGCTLPLSKRFQNSFGLSFKYIVSALAPGIDKNGAGVGQSFAVDAGYLSVFPSGLRLGINLANMGPDIFYIDEENKDPLPFTFNAAVAYTHEFVIDNIRIVSISGEFRMDKELVINHPNGDPDPFYKALFVDPFNEPASYEFQEINYHLGFEGGLYNTLFLRCGMLVDPLGERYETHFGLGGSLFNHLRLDLSLIIAPEGYMKGFSSLVNKYGRGATGARHAQFQITLAIDALCGWTEQDGEWWMVNEERRGW